MDKEVVKYTYMMGDNKVTDIIENSNGVIDFINYSDDILDTAFGIKKSPVSVEDLEKFFKRRCFPETRGNVKRILKTLGVGFYSPRLIVQKTHGVMFDDIYWIRFEGEDNLKYSEVRESLGL